MGIAGKAMQTVAPGSASALGILNYLNRRKRGVKPRKKKINPRRSPTYDPRRGRNVGGGRLPWDDRRNFDMSKF